MKARSAVKAGLVLAGMMAMSATAMADPSADEQWASAKTVAMTSLGAASRSEYQSPALVVAESPCQWEGAMLSLVAHGGLSTNRGVGAPEGVNWHKQTVALVALGSVPQGYSMDVTECRRMGNTLLVQVHVGYQDTENYSEMLTPVVAVAVDGHGMKQVLAMYDWAPPTAATSALASLCDSAPDRQLGRSGESSATQPNVTWGALKSMYR